MPPEVLEQNTTSETVAEQTYTPPENDASARSDTSQQVNKGKADEGKGVGESKVTLPASIKPPVKTGRFQARISDLVGQRDTVERENAQLRERLSRMQGIPSKAEAAGGGNTEVAKSATPAVGDLNPEDFPTYAEYVTALVDKTMKDRETATRSEKAKTDYEAYKQERMTTFNAKAAPLAEEYGDGFWDAITDSNLPVSEAMADAVLELDDIGPYTMLWLAAHRDEAAKMARMNPRAATIAIGRLAAQLDFEIKGGTGSVEGNTDTQGQSPQNTMTPQVSQTPKPTPIPTPRGSTPASLDASPNDKDDINTWLRKETDRLRRQNPNGRFYGAQ